MGLFVSNKIGKLGEDIAVKYLENKGFSIVERNFLRKTGEIDVICEKSGIIHFIEVKSVSRRTPASVISVSPEENLHKHKAKRLSRTIEIYLNEKSQQNREFEIGLITVSIETYSKKASIHFFKNIIL